MRVAYAGHVPRTTSVHFHRAPSVVAARNVPGRRCASRETAENSPYTQAGKIRVPVFLAAGDEDDIAPPVHTRKMNDALKALGKPVEMHIYEKEGHGNYLMKNRIDLANRILAFLDANIGPDSPNAK